VLKTSARAGKSTPVAGQRASKKPKTGIEKISAIVAKEEETTQKVLDLKKLRVKGENDKELAKIKAKTEVKIQQMKLRAELTQKKLELAQKKMDNEFQLQMAWMGHPQMGPAYTQASSSSMIHSNRAASGSGFSDVASVTSSSHSIQHDPELEFYSTYDLDPATR
jgi:hypothetical protein